MGEAAKNTPNDLKEKYPEVPWKGMVGMRDKVIHGYFGVDLKIVWDTVRKRISEVKPLFERILKELEKEKNLTRTTCERSGNLWGNRWRDEVLVACLLCKSIMIV
ncbi:MAG: HepT-like ribonuclease domain-containing protein [Candidatus Freyarchaeota archaeon]